MNTLEEMAGANPTEMPWWDELLGHQTIQHGDAWEIRLAAYDIAGFALCLSY